MSRAYQENPLSMMEEVFAMEEETFFPLRNNQASSSATDIFNTGRNVTDHGSQTDLNYESISERRYRRKARPMPHKEFSLASILSLDTPYRHKTIGVNDSSNYRNGDPINDSHLKGNRESECNFEGVVNVKASESSESQACYGNENIVTKLKSEYIRWFYKCEGDREWTCFTGYDSTRIESKFKQRQKEFREKANVSGGAGVEEFGSSSENQERKFTLVNKNYFQGIESPFSTKRQRNTNGSKKWFGAWIDDDESSEDLNGETIGEPAEDGSDENNEGTTSKKADNLVYVRGGLYEADVDKWTCTATYWPADSTEITRGTWFYDGTWQPLPADQAQRLEDEHLGKFAGTPLTAPVSTEPQAPDSPTRSKPVIHQVSFPDFHVDWTSPTEIHLYSKAASYQFMRSVGQRLGFQTWGHRLCRGFHKPASIVDRPSEISHVVFVVHGIGQKMDTGRIVRNCGTFRDCVANMRNRYFPQQLATGQRAEFFPVEWRSFAKLDGDIVEAITPNKLLSLRQLLNATAMDIMYYTSPLYRIEIQNALRNELNRIYANFVKRNPNFEARGGKVSIMAHSLGAVITFDIITGYAFDFQPSWPGGSIDVISESTEEINHEGIIIIDDVAGVNVPKQPKKLQFKLEHFFCLGSPLAVFLALRWREPHNPDLRSYILPHHLCKRIYNVFHPSDPVAYRLEPLLNQAYRGIEPLCINTYNSLIQSKYEQMAKEAIGRECYYFEKGGENIVGVPIHEAHQQQPSSQRLNPFTGLKSPPTNSKDFGRGWWNIMKYWKNPGNQFENNDSSVDGETQTDETNPNSPTAGEDSHSDSASNSTTKSETEVIEDDLDYRMDYVLRESNLSSSYLAALTSHTCYWSSPDIAFFILTHLHNGPLDLKKQDKTI